MCTWVAAAVVQLLVWYYMGWRLESWEWLIHGVCIIVYTWSMLFFFFQAEDGIRDVAVTGVQTCALPICRHGARGAPDPGRPACGEARPHRPVQRVHLGLLSG